MIAHALSAASPPEHNSDLSVVFFAVHFVFAGGCARTSEAVSPMGRRQPRDAHRHQASSEDQALQLAAGNPGFIGRS